MSNADIKAAAKSNKVFLWEVARKLKISESTFTRWLRTEMNAADKQQIFTIIDELAAEKENAAHSATNTMNS